MSLGWAFQGAEVSVSARRIVALGISAATHVAGLAVGYLRRPVGYGRAGGCVVLYYHGIRANQRERFRRQMAWLKAWTTVVPVVEIGCGVRPGQWGTCITFDDALDSVRENAVPILQELGLPASVFAVSGNLGSRPAWAMAPGDPDAQERVMTADELAGLPGDRIEVGSHTVTHPNLATLPPGEACRELVESKRTLERIVGCPVAMLSVPFGEYTEETLRLAREAGYRTVLTCDPEVIRPGAEGLVVGRFKVSPDDGWLEFKLKALGAYRWRRPLRGLRRRLGSVAARVSSRFGDGHPRRAMRVGERSGMSG